MWAGGTAETQEPETQEGRERPRPRAPPRTPPAAGAGWVYGNRVATAVLCQSVRGCGRGAPGLGGCRPCGQGGPSPSPAESGLRPGPSSLSLPASCPFPSPPLRVAAPAAAPAGPGRRQGGRPALPAHARRGVLGGRQGPFSGLSASGHLSPPWHVAHWTASAISGLALVSPEAGNVMPAPQAPAGRPGPEVSPAEQPSPRS